MASEDDSEVSQVRENIGCSGAPTNSDKITLAEEIHDMSPEQLHDQLMSVMIQNQQLGKSLLRASY